MCWNLIFFSLWGKKTDINRRVTCYICPTTNESFAFPWYHQWCWMAADNQNRLASFTAWKRGRCKLALHWAKWGGKYSWFRPKTGPGSCSHSAYFPPPPLSWPQPCGQNSSGKQQVFLGVICCYLPPQSRPDRTSPAAEAAPLSFTSSFSSFFHSTPQIFCFSGVFWN